MRAQNILFQPELVTHQSLDPKGIPNAVPKLSYKWRRRSTVSPGTMRKGNYKDPQPWNYTVISGDKYMAGVVQKEHIAKKYNGWISSGPYGGVIPDHIFVGQAADPYNKCLDKLYASIRSSVDLSIDIYQVNQTVKMLKSFSSALRSPLKTFAIAMRSVARKGYRPDGRLGISSRWLEWQYGIKPSMNTIYEMTDDLIGELNGNGCFGVKARASFKADALQTFSNGNFCDSAFVVKVQHQDSRRCELALRCSIGDAQMNALSQFSSLNPVSFVYENIPYSFVLDWLIDVGGYLRNIETACMTGLVFHSGYRSDSRRQTAYCYGVTTNDPYGYRRIPNIEGHVEKITMNRTVLSAMPRPELPSFNVSLGTERLLSAAALLRQFIKSPKR